MATYTKTVDPNGGADYASIALWEAGEQTLYASGDIAIADCRRTGATKDTSSVTVSGWTAGVIPKIIVNPAHRHEGRWAEQRADGNYIYILSVAPSGYAAVTISVPSVEVHGLACNLVTSGIKAFFDGGVSRLINACLVSGSDKNATEAIGVYLSGNNQIVRNTVLFNLTKGMHSQWGGSGISIENCTIYDCGDYGIDKRQATSIQNTAIFGCGVSDYNMVNATGTLNNNVSSDATAPGTPVAHNQTAYADYFVDHLNGDFRLKNTSQNLWGISGQDLSAQFTTDAIGTTRTVPWDIGAFMYAAAGLTAPTLTAPADTATGVALRPTFTWS